jgi:predicted unusual protein kinase regulating ubiquinone biosynthesis (AarF/ABC1/UbiB family)
MAIEMGGVWIKVGQFLSTRVDVLPPEFTNELAGLQDEVPPADFEEIVVVAESEFGMPLISKYLWFDPKPLAAASLGQVHKAKIYKPSSSNPATLDDDNLQQAQKSKSNESITVVVKVQRPNIEAIIYTDLSALKTVGNWLQKYPPLRKRANIPALINEFTRILYEELDYIAEGRNANVFAEQYKSDPQIRIPDVVWSHTTKRVLTLENVWGIKITDYAAITAAGVDRSEVAIQLIDVYLKQIFEDGFFHADPHPGNLFINPIPLMPPISKYFRNGSNKSEVFWQLTFVDFGMVGHVPEYMKRGLRDLLIGVGTKDTPRVIKAYQELDILLPGADTEQIESLIYFGGRTWKNSVKLAQMKLLS